MDNFFFFFFGAMSNICLNEDTAVLEKMFPFEEYACLPDIAEISKHWFIIHQSYCWMVCDVLLLYAKTITSGLLFFPLN